MSDNTNKVKITSDSLYAGRLRQTSIYFAKFARIFIAEHQWMMIVMSAIIAFLIAIVVRGDIFVSMEGTLKGGLAVGCVCLWNGVFNSIQVVCKERAIIKREHRSGLSITAYLASHMMLQAILCVIQTIVTIAVIRLFGIEFPKTNIGTHNFTLNLFITMFLVTYAADMMGLMVSCIVKNTTMAMTVMPFILIVQLVFSGVVFSVPQRVAFLPDVTLVKWGVSAIAIDGNYNELPSAAIYNQIKKMANANPTIQSIVDIVAEDNITHFFARYAQKPEYARETARLLDSWMHLLIFIVVFGLIGFIFLKFIDHDKR